MTSEYVRLSNQEQFFGKRSLLECQLGILALLQRQAAYERLRTEEIAQKIQLKKSTEEAQNAIRLLDTLLPKLPSKERKAGVEKVQELKEEENVLEKEIEEIKKKLAKLQ